MKQFLLFQKKIFIYGAGSMGLKMLSQKNLAIEGFIDKRGDEVKEFNGYSVFSINAMKEFLEKDSYCIIIAVRDVFSHSEIALDFLNAGFVNLIFKPHSVLNSKSDSSEELLAISDAYDSLTVQGLDVVKEIPCYAGEALFDFENASIINENFEDETSSGMVRFYAPSELLFSNDLYDDSNLWTKCNFAANYIAVDLYRSVQEDSNGKEKEFDRYVNLYAVPGAIRSGVNISGSWKNTVLKTRLSAFTEMKKRLAMDKEFFVKHCTTVSLLPPCRLQLIKSGKSRVSFLTALRVPFIPVMMQKKDYERYVNIDTAKTVYDFICRNKMTNTVVPIPHPYFYGFKTNIADYAYLWKSKVARILFDITYEKKQNFDTDWLSICDASDDNGSMSRYLKNLGFTISRKKKSDEFTLLLDRLFSIEIAEDDCGINADCFVLMSMDENYDIEKLLGSILPSTQFVFAFFESSLIESVKEKLNETFEISQIASTVSCGKSYFGIYMRRKR